MAAIELFNTPLFSKVISYYRMEGNSNDAAGSNNGTDTSISYNSSYGKFNQGASFNGSSSFIDLGNPSNLRFSGTFWLHTWINEQSFPAGGAQQNIIGKGFDGSNTPYQFYLLVTGGITQLSFICYNGAVHGTTWNISGWSTGSFHMIDGVFDGSNYIIYFDGLAVSTTSDATPPPSTTKNVRIGSLDVNGSNSYFLNAYLDDVALSNYAPTATEILNLFNGTWGIPNKINQINQAIPRASRW